MTEPIWTRGKVPYGFWTRRSNRVAYLRWLGQQLGYRKPTDWYRVTKGDFAKHHGAGLFKNYYGNSRLKALHEYRPNYDWLPWLFLKAPNKFWKKRSNRLWYLRWLGDRLRFKNLDGWYQLTYEDFQANCGSGLLSGYYGDSPSAAVRDLFPNRRWLDWLFSAVPSGFFGDTERTVWRTYDGYAND